MNTNHYYPNGMMAQQTSPPMMNNNQHHERMMVAVDNSDMSRTMLKSFLGGNIGGNIGGNGSTFFSSPTTATTTPTTMTMMMNPAPPTKTTMVMTMNPTPPTMMMMAQQPPQRHHYKKLKVPPSCFDPPMKKLKEVMLSSDLLLFQYKSRDILGKLQIHYEELFVEICMSYNLRMEGNQKKFISWLNHQKVVWNPAYIAGMKQKRLQQRTTMTASPHPPPEGIVGGPSALEGSGGGGAGKEDCGGEEDMISSPPPNMKRKTRQTMADSPVGSGDSCGDSGGGGGIDGGGDNEDQQLNTNSRVENPGASKSTDDKTEDEGLLVDWNDDDDDDQEQPVATPPPLRVSTRQKKSSSVVSTSRQKISTRQRQSSPKKQPPMIAPIRRRSGRLARTNKSVTLPLPPPQPKPNALPPEGIAGVDGGEEAQPRVSKRQKTAKQQQSGPPTRRPDDASKKNMEVETTANTSKFSPKKAPTRRRPDHLAHTNKRDTLPPSQPKNRRTVTVFLTGNGLFPPYTLKGVYDIRTTEGRERMYQTTRYLQHLRDEDPYKLEISVNVLAPFHLFQGKNDSLFHLYGNLHDGTAVDRNREDMLTFVDCCKEWFEGRLNALKASEVEVVCVGLYCSGRNGSGPIEICRWLADQHFSRHAHPMKVTVIDINPRPGHRTWLRDTCRFVDSNIEQLGMDALEYLKSIDKPNAAPDLSLPSTSTLFKCFFHFNKGTRGWESKRCPLSDNLCYTIWEKLHEENDVKVIGNDGRLTRPKKKITYGK